MAGTIFGLGLSQRVDTNGNPDAGWLLYLYAANSSTPVTAYQDTALTTGLELPWPIEADSSGMLPSFWLADGSYRARATSGDQSKTYFDLGSVLALGASSGSAPSGGVDPNAIFTTGDTMFQEVAGTRAGWVRDNGRTIGSSTSGATERANADCQPLFVWLWSKFSDAVCPVVGGRGATAAADWSANKQITLIDKRGVSAVGLDDMGNSAAGKFSGVPFDGSGNETTAGSICGENSHTLATTEIPSHNHGVTDPGHSHKIVNNSVFGSDIGVTTSSTVSNADLATSQGIATNTKTTGITINNAGGGGSHNTMHRSITGTWYRKL